MGQGTSVLNAVRSNSPEDQVVQQLKNLGSSLNLNARDEEERTALHWAAAEGKAKIATALIELGINVDVVDINGDTAAHTAAFRNQPEVLKALIEKGANINLQDSSGMTPLHWAVSQVSKPCIELLVESGADLTIKNDRDHTPLDTARTHKRRIRDELIDLIEMARRRAQRRLADAGAQSDKSATEAPASTPVGKQYQRLVSLASLWGLVKYTHPYLAYRTDINWDKALIDVLPTVANPSTTTEQLCQAISDMLSRLNDPNTRVLYVDTPGPGAKKKPGKPKKGAQKPKAAAAKKTPSKPTKSKEKISEKKDEKEKDVEDPILGDAQPTPKSPSPKATENTPKTPQKESSKSVPASPSTGANTPPAKQMSPNVERTPVKATIPTTTAPATPSAGPSVFVAPPPQTSPNHVQGRPQPYVEVTRDKFAVIIATDHEHFVLPDKLPQFVNAFASAANSAVGIIFDLRCTRESGRGQVALASLFATAFKLFLTEDLPLPTMRQRQYYGLPESRRSPAPQYHHSFVTDESEVLSCSNPPPLATSNESSQGNPKEQRLPLKPMCFIVDKNTPVEIINIALGMRARSGARIVYQVEDGDYRLVGKTPSTASAAELLVYEPHIAASVFHFSGDEIKVLVRQTERVNPDGSVGFSPDEIVIRPKSERLSPSQTSAIKHASVTATAILGQPDISLESDLAIKTAVSLLHSRKSALPPTYRSVQALRRVEDEYTALGDYPPLEYRYLALFRLWNALHYFYAYKELVGNALNNALLEFLPRIERASNALEYATAIAEMLTRLQDTHASVRCAQLNDWVGTHSVPLKLGNVEGKTVVTFIMDDTEKEEALNSVKVGDILLSVDGVPVEQRRQELMKIFAASTPQALRWRLDMKLLAGPLNSKCKLELQRPNGAESPQTITVELTRSIPSSVVSVRTGPVFTTLDTKDKFGNPIGYIDMSRLSMLEIDDAIEAIKACTSLILDIRGHTKGTLFRLGPLLAKSNPTTVAYVQVPTLLPSIMTEGIQPSITQSPQSPMPLNSYDRAVAAELQVNNIIALINEETISQGEYSVAYFKAVRPDIVLVGTPTSGTLGNLTNIVLPGGIVVNFTGLGIATPVSGPNVPRIVQRQGITPDVVVTETIEGVAAGRDEVLEAAIARLANSNSTVVQLK